MGETYVFKVALLGDGSVGKTCLIRRFVHNKFDDKYFRTLGANIYKREVFIEHDGVEYDINLQIWDVLGQDVYTQVINSALRKVRGVIFVTDMTNRRSLINLRKWIDRVYRNVGSANFIFIGNKADLENKAFGLAELQKYAAPFHGETMLTSAKTGENVEACFDLLAMSLINKTIAPPRDLVNLPRFTTEINPRIHLADIMIDEFCKELGGYERAMPVTRTVFKNNVLDFEELTDDDLIRILDSLTDIILDERGPFPAGEFKDRMQIRIDSCSE